MFVIIIGSLIILWVILWIIDGYLQEEIVIREQELEELKNNQKKELHLHNHYHKR